MNTHVLLVALRALEQATKDVIRSQNIEKVEDTIQGCAIIAAVAGVGSGWLPGAGKLVATTAWVSAIWGMYVKINKDLEITIKGNVLKSLAAAILTNILASAGSLILMLVGSLLLSFIPGPGSAGAMLIDGMIGYITVYASGVLYIIFLTKLFKAGKGFNIAENEVKDVVNAVVKDNDIYEILKEGKRAYKEDKKAGKFKNNN